MSILDTFYILFKADTSELKKGVEIAEKEVNRVEKDLEHLSKTSDKVGESFNGVLKSVVGLFAGFTSFHAVLSGAQGAIESIRQVGNASRELNVDVSALDAWGHAVQRTGGSAEQFQSALQGVAEYFGTTNEVALKVLPTLAQVFSRLNPRNAQIYGKSLGLDQATILLLQQGRREVEDIIKQQQRFGLVTKQQVEETRKFDNALYNAGLTYQQFYRELVTPLLPGFTKAINYLIEHKDLITGTFIAVGGSAALLAAPFVLANISVIGLTASVFALIGAFALVFEDIKKFREGEPSVTGYIARNVQNSPGRSLTLGARLTNFLGIKSENPIIQGLINQIAGRSLTDNRSTSVNIGEVKIVTQATDANGMALGASDSLHKYISQTIDHVDNGVAR